MFKGVTFTALSGGISYRLAACSLVPLNDECFGSVCAYDESTGKFISKLATYDDMSTTWQYKPRFVASQNAGVIATYDNGFPCPGVPGQTATVRMMFVCAPSSPTNTVSVSQGDGVCDFVFTIPSLEFAACSGDAPTFIPCATRSFNMGALNSTSSPYFAKGNDGFIYKINVCGPVRDGGECQAADGMLCKYDATTNKYLSTLAVWDGGAGMSWQSGFVPGVAPHSQVSTVEAYTMNGLTSCDPTGRPARVRWVFSCARFTSQFDVNVSSDGCSVVVSVGTPLAC